MIPPSSFLLPQASSSSCDPPGRRKADLACPSPLLHLAPPTEGPGRRIKRSSMRRKRGRGIQKSQPTPSLVVVTLSCLKFFPPLLRTISHTSLSFSLSLPGSSGFGGQEDDWPSPTSKRAAAAAHNNGRRPAADAANPKRGASNNCYSIHLSPTIIEKVLRLRILSPGKRRGKKKWRPKKSCCTLKHGRSFPYRKGSVLVEEKEEGDRPTSMPG